MRIARITANVFFMILRSFLFKFNTHTRKIFFQTDAVEYIHFAVAVHIGVARVDRYAESGKILLQTDAVEYIYFAVVIHIARNPARDCYTARNDIGFHRALIQSRCLEACDRHLCQPVRSIIQYLEFQRQDVPVNYIRRFVDPDRLFVFGIRLIFLYEFIKPQRSLIVNFN